MKRPNSTLGMRHVALFCRNLEQTEKFYTDLLGMDVEWRPDADNVYLTTQGADNVALHRWQGEEASGPQCLDHIGFIIKDIDQVDDWYAFLTHHKVEVVKPPKTHRDGARSFYCKDPDGVLVQIIYHPPISQNA